MSVEKTSDTPRRVVVKRERGVIVFKILILALILFVVIVLALPTGG